MKITTASFGSIAQLPENLVDLLNNGTAEAIKEALLQLRYGGYATGTNMGLKRTRSVLNTVVPTTLFVSIEDVKNELYKYQNISSQKVGEKILGEAEKRKRVTKIESALVGVNFKDLIDDLIKALKEGIKEFINSSEVIDIPYKVLQQRLATGSGANIPLTKIIGPNKCYNVKPTKGNIRMFGPNIDYVFVFSNFNTAAKIQENITPKILKVLQDKSVIGQEENNLAGLKAILDLGHALAKTPATEESPEEVLGNFPKQTQVILDKILNIALSNDGVLPQEDVFSVTETAADFVSKTHQIENFVEINKDFKENFVSMFVTLGGQIVKFENSVLNQYRGTAYEQLYPGAKDSEVIGKLSEYLKLVQDSIVGDVRKKINKRKREIIKVLTNVIATYPSSPSARKYIVDAITAPLSKKVIGPFKQVKPVSKTQKPTNIISAKTVKAVTDTKKAKVSPAPRINIRTPRVAVKSMTNLTNLLNQLNRLLHDQLKKNMGIGNSVNVLNYRTGRFARSVKIERMSESRQGMITAFYSYMKNPYATFSEGGRQQSPKTRDPKLLISKSIREIAKTMVTNQLRAVNV